MALDADKYRINVKSIQLLMEEKTPKERLDFIAMAANATRVPIIIVSCYVGELYGFSDELNTYIDKLKKFYHITEVVNVRKG